MSKEYEIVRLYYEGLTQREICTALSCGHDRVSRVLKAAKAAGVDREAAETLGDSGIRELLPRSIAQRNPTERRPTLNDSHVSLNAPGSRASSSGMNIVTTLAAPIYNHIDIPSFASCLTSACE